MQESNMNIIAPSYVILTPLTRDILPHIELAGRTCYKSEDKITCESAGPFVQRIARVLKHESVLEHASVTVRFICDRGVSHELVRHRIASFSQESTRYCNYSKNGVTFVKPPWVTNLLLEPTASRMWDTMFLSRSDHEWCFAMANAEMHYNELLSLGQSPQQARSVLPNSLKTEIVMTANIREWRHIFSLRCAPTAHPQMRELMIPLANEFHATLPELFDAYELKF